MNYCSQSPTRGRAMSHFDSYLDTSQHNSIGDNIAPPRHRSSTPSAAVRRAIQVLDKTKRQKSVRQNDRWSPSVDHDRLLEDSTRLQRSPSPIRSRSASPIRNFSRLVEIERENFQDALRDSEVRREILLKKLADAQKTMEIQNERLRDGEIEAGECRATIRLLKQLQHELETKLQFVQKERETLLGRSKRDAEEKEGLRKKLEDAIHEANRLKCQLDLLLADKQQHHVTLEHMHKSIKDLKDQIKSCSNIQAATRLELETSLQQGEVAKQRVELLEKEKNNAESELEKNQSKLQSLINRNTEVGGRLNRCQLDLRKASEKLDKTNFELGHNKEELAMCRETIKKQSRDLVELQRSHGELQSDCERALRYNEELEKTVQSIKEINHELKQAKVAQADDNTELHASLAKTRLELAKIVEENETNRVELKESRKTCKKLTDELLDLKPEVENLKKKVQESIVTHSVNVKKLALVEAQKSQLACEKEDAATHLSTLKESYEELKSHHEREIKSLNKEIKDLRQHKERIASQCRDAQAQFSRIREEMDANNQHSHTQLEHWRQACSKLTSLVEEKDEDLRECSAQRREAEESANLAEAQKRTMAIQLKEAQISQEELNHLRMEQKRLSKECAENQQLIAVLEMQRDILAKSPSKSNTTDVTQSKIEKLQAEVNLLQSKLKDAEVQKEKLLFEGTDEISMDPPLDEKEANIKHLKGMNQVLAEQVASLKQENEILQCTLDDQSRLHERAAKEWKREKQQLDLRMASMNDEINALNSCQSRKAKENNSEVKGLKAELEWTKEELEEKMRELVVMRGELVVMENANKRVEDRLQECNDTKMWNRENFSSGKNDDSGDARIRSAKLDAAQAEIEVMRIQAQELEDTKASQNALIEDLKLQLEKNLLSSTESEGSAESKSGLRKEMKELKKNLKKAALDVGIKEKQLIELKKQLLEMQKSEQKARQERDELQGKAIIMESLNDSRQDLVKELKRVQQEKLNLEKQLNNFVTSKTCQTPPIALSLVEDLDREMERQYETVCERNKWLEARISSLLREIELLRDQNSLALEQKVSAEEEARRLREELKSLQTLSKGSRQQSEVENIHLQHRNAEKMQKILDLERELSEKKLLIAAMTKEMENQQKKSEKGKILSFMKKLRKSSDAPTTPSAGPLKRNRSLSKSPKSPNSSVVPLSPTLTYDGALETQVGSCTSSTDRCLRLHNSDCVAVVRGNFEDKEFETSPSSSRGTKSSSHYSSNSPKHESSRGEDEAFFADDYIAGEPHPQSLEVSREKSSHPPSPESYEPHPEKLRGLPSPTSSPSLPSPSMVRLSNMPVLVVAASDESEALDSESEEAEDVDPKQHLQSMSGSPFNMLPNARSSPRNLSLSRPRSQPTFSGTSIKSQTKKKNLTLV